VGLEVLEDLAIQEGLEFPDNIMKRPGQLNKLSRTRQACIMKRPGQFTEQSKTSKHNIIHL